MISSGKILVAEWDSRHLRADAGCPWNSLQVIFKMFPGTRNVSSCKENACMAPQFFWVSCIYLFIQFSVSFCVRCVRGSWERPPAMVLLELTGQLTGVRRVHQACPSCVSIMCVHQACLSCVLGTAGWQRVPLPPGSHSQALCPFITLFQFVAHPFWLWVQRAHNADV